MRTYSAVKSQVQYRARAGPACRCITMAMWSANSRLLAARSLKSSGWPCRSTGIPAIVMSARAGSNGTPARPAAAKKRAQLGSAPANAGFTSGEVACGRFAFRTTHCDLDHALCALAVGNDLQRERMADMFERSGEIAMRFASVFDRRSARLAIGENQQRIIRRSVTIDADGVEGARR